MRAGIIGAALALAVVAGPAGADGVAHITGAAQFDGQRLTIAGAHIGDHVEGVVTYEAGETTTVIDIDCLEFLPSGNLSTIGGTVFASGTTIDETRYFIKIVDGGSFTPLTPNSYVGVSTVGWGGSVCDAERVQAVPITDGEFLIVH